MMGFRGLLIHRMEVTKQVRTPDSVGGSTLSDGDRVDRIPCRLSPLGVVERTQLSQNGIVGNYAVYCLPDVDVARGDKIEVSAASGKAPDVGTLWVVTIQKNSTDHNLKVVCNTDTVD